MHLVMRRARLYENFLWVPAVALVAAVVSYWALVIDRVPPIDLDGGRVTPNSVEAGGMISARWQLERLRPGAYSGVISRQIIDSTNVVWRIAEQQVYDSVYWENQFIAKEVQVPFGTAWGVARYRFQACFRGSGITLTRWFPVCWQEPDLSFEVLPPKSQP